MSVEVEHISKRFGDFVALDDVSLKVSKGELVALLGPSGSGKTTLLRIIAGLERPDAGTILLDDQEVVQKEIGERNVGFVFQHYALFRNMSVFENVAFGLRIKGKLGEEEIKDRAMGLLRLVHLSQLADRYPGQLSGGQRQRVALARALAVEPQLLLLDEPFGALDAKVRQELRRWMRRLHDEIQITSLFVTHDQEEALEVADTVVVMNGGRVEQIGTPEQIYSHPANSFVYDFMGNYNSFAGWQMADGEIWLKEYDTGALRELPKDGSSRIFARPHDMEIVRSPIGDPAIRARVLFINRTGALVKAEVQTEKQAILRVEIPWDTAEELNLRIGETVYVRPRSMRIFAGE